MSADKQKSEVAASRIAQLSPEKRELLKKRLAENKRRESARAAEPIAVVGMSCRFPGGADSPAAFWRLLTDGVDAISEVPPERWNREAVCAMADSSEEAEALRWGGFLDSVDQFDPAFFGISPREAERMDPQQRLLLETAWEALEAAGQSAERLAGSDAGVFLGVHSQSSDYYAMQARAPRTMDTYTSTGGAHSIVANRLSYLLDLRGPSLVVDTACSSSLVALHLACQSLRAGESDLALAGGVNLLLAPETSLAFSKLQFLSPEGRCKTFDAAANGFVRGEGCGVIVLRRLADARASGDPILALIRGSAVNQDGATNGLTAPNGPAQVAVLRRALKNAGVEAGDVSLVETHGTGTSLGDPIEVEALLEVRRAAQGAAGPCYLGAVKSNIGHLEAAAGIAGVIKTVLCLRRRFIPPNVHFKQLNPHLSLDGQPFEIPAAGLAWNPLKGSRLAGVSSFGFGGTNAHVILEEAPDESTMGDDRLANVETGAAQLLVLSARSAPALEVMSERFVDFLQERASDANAAPQRDIAYSAAVRRTHHDHRLAVVGDSLGEWREKLAALTLHSSPFTLQPKLAFICSGQGPQWFAMGRELFASEPVYRETVERCAALFSAQEGAGWNLLDELAKDEAASRLDQTEIAQPALFALQVALAELWRAWGVEPDAVVGHSVGEVAAACIAGALSLDDAARVVFHRGRLMQRATGQGRMAAVGLSAAEAESAAARGGGRLVVAAVNGPASTVLSGDADALEEALRELAARGVFNRMLPVDYAFHSPLMGAYQAELTAALTGIEARPPELAIASTVTGALAQPADFGAAYWARNIREPVRFADALEPLFDEGCTAFLELSPHPVLTPSVMQCIERRAQAGGFDEGAPAVVPSLRRGQPERATLLTALGALYERGVNPEWPRLFPDGCRFVELPPYPWQRQRYWLAAPPPAGDPLDRRLYEVAWARQPEAAAGSAPGSTPPAAGSWLILADVAGVGAALADEVRRRQGLAALAFAGGVFECDGEQRYLLNAAEPEHYRQLLREVTERFGAPPEIIVQLWALDLPLNEDADAAEMAQAAQTGCTSALYLTQALANLSAAPDAPSRLWLVTRGAQPAPGADARLQLPQAPLWGLGRTIALEHAAAWGGLIDLDPAASAVDAARRLCETIPAPNGDNQLAWRAGVCYAARLRRAAEPTPRTPPLQWRSDAAYLITGGLGGLGLQIARWLAEQGVRNLVLMGRRAPSVAAQQALDKIRQLGANVVTVQGDVADTSNVQNALEICVQPPPPAPSPQSLVLRGVIHAAGVIELAPLESVTAETIAAACRAKIAGAWVLHQLTQDCALDFFALFSSGAGIWGSKHLAPYAAANQFLDALAHYRRARGWPALCIDWGWWEGGGKLPVAEAHFRRIGFNPMPRADCLKTLERLLASDAIQRAVADFDWSVFKPIYETGGHRGFLDDVQDDAPANWDAARAAPASPERGEEPATRTETDDRAAAFRATLDARQTPGERREFLELHVRRLVADVLGYADSAALDARQGFFSMGMDSILTLQLRNQLAALLGLELPATLAFEHSSIEALTDHLFGEVLVDAAADQVAAPPPSTPEAPPESTVQEEGEMLSEDELAAKLARRIKQTRERTDQS